MRYAGAGNKIVAAARGEVDCTAQHKFGGPWDTCAPEAVLRAMGGELTDMCGDALAVYTPGAEAGRSNALGFVATGPDSAISHGELCAAMRAAPEMAEYRAGLGLGLPEPSTNAAQQPPSLATRLGLAFLLLVLLDPVVWYAVASISQAAS